MVPYWGITFELSLKIKWMSSKKTFVDLIKVSLIMLDLNIAVYGSYCNHLFFRVLSLFFFSYYLMASPQQDEMPRNIKRKKRENETKNWPVLQLNSPLACSSVWMILTKTAVFLLSLSSLLSLPYLFICVNNIHKESIYLVEGGNFKLTVLPGLFRSLNDVNKDHCWVWHQHCYNVITLPFHQFQWHPPRSLLSLALPGLSICMNNIHK